MSKKIFKVLRMSLFINLYLLFYLGISSNYKNTLNNFKSIDFYIDIFVSLLFAFIMLRLYQRKLKSIKG